MSWSGSLVNGDVAVAGRSEWPTVPVGVAFGEPQAGPVGHQVQLSRPAVADGYRPQMRPRPGRPGTPPRALGPRAGGGRHRRPPSDRRRTRDHRIRPWPSLKQTQSADATHLPPQRLNPEACSSSSAAARARVSRALAVVLARSRTEFVRSLGNRSASGQHEWRQLATARIGELA